MSENVTKEKRYRSRKLRHEFPPERWSAGSTLIHSSWYDERMQEIVVLLKKYQNHIANAKYMNCKAKHKSK